MMASAEQIKALLESHADGDDARFYSVAMQLAAHEARLGHGKLAKELRDLIDDAKMHRGLAHALPEVPQRGALSNLLAWSYPKTRLGDLVLTGHLMDQLQRVVREHRQASRILEQGLSLKRKLLFIGHQGTGKRFSASVLAGELGLPLIEVPIGALHRWFKYEAVGELQKIFHVTKTTRGVYFFDATDNVVSSQKPEGDADDKGMLLYNILAMIEQNRSHSVLVTSMKYLDTLDVGAFNCFDDILEYDFPNEWQIAKLLQRRLGHVAVKGTDWSRLATRAFGLSYSEVSAAADDSLKLAIMSEQREVDDSNIDSILAERTAISAKLNSYAKPSG